ncbi:hypothetical protein T03_4949 [Trichinella britovi]|uniref:Uncharacterized protein n=1 Tax=Trichinella britovi TaxID=45882 RepID=A0A0V0YT13_TRIBR|nr:hypothetical protein T03_4949 [Trichinella britovi]
MCNLRSMQECETTQSAFQILMQNHKGDDSHKRRAEYSTLEEYSPGR